ncbi:MAG: tetratricopeptide repeat protein, partial [bacterium]
MKSLRRLVFVTPILLCACLGSSDGPTLAELHDVPADLEDVEIEDGIAQAISGYRRFLEEAPRSRLTPEAMRRLADLELEKDFGILGRRAQKAGTGASPAAPASVADPSDSADSSDSSEVSGRAPESDARFERPATSLAPDASGSVPASPDLPGDTRDASAGPLEAIALYDRILEKYPDYAQNDEVLYQKARAYEELGRIEEAMAVTARLLEEYPESRHRDEIRFRRGESFFVRRKYLDAEREYASVVREGAASEYYELAIYKLGWALYKQMMLEEALDQYLALLDHKVSSGYDFEQTGDEAQAARMADTYRVISLCFSELGGPAAVRGFFDAHGSRTYEDRIYRHLAEFYFEKRRYQDAASVYDAFIELHPFHHAAPRFRMRTVEIYEEGGFPRLVLESKEVFAADYGIQAPFWEHFEFDREPEVVRFLKQNLKDLASHHHAGYQEASEPSLARERFAEAERWYRDFLASFSNDPETPAMHHRLADLLLEEQRYVDAAVEYERTAYDYPDHEGAAAAGHAAIFAHREFQKTATGPELESSRRAAVDVTLRFVERFPEHEHAAAALGAAAEDLFTLGRFERAIELGERLVSAYPSAAPAVRRSAWSVVAHSSFELESFARAEAAYARVLDLTEESGESRQAVVDNLAASIYKQGEIARAEGDSRTAATHFMRVAEVAPGSGIRPIADYDAAGAWIALEDWAMASSVLDAFRSSFPEHELNREATRQLAFVFQEQGDSERAAAEYERVAGEATEPDLRRDALSTAGALYEEAGNPRRALSVYREFVTEFTQPIEELVVVHFNMAEIHRKLEEKP